MVDTTDSKSVNLYDCESSNLSLGKILRIINLKINIEKKWFSLLSTEFEKPYMINLINFIKNLDTVVYPNFEQIFFCLNVTHFEKIKVIIIGQDPYCQKNQADGLAFSVLKGEKIPSSLKNIYTELNDDLGIPISKNGCLLKWANQGVLLLNSVLTVEESKPGSHFGLGWEIFTDKLVYLLSKSKKKIFVLWGKYALNKIKFININNNFIIHSSHPSNKSAHVSFLGSRPFSKINMYLKMINENSIDWNNN